MLGRPPFGAQTQRLCICHSSSRCRKPFGKPCNLKPCWSSQARSRMVTCAFCVCVCVYVCVCVCVCLWLCPFLSLFLSFSPPPLPLSLCFPSKSERNKQLKSKPFVQHSTKQARTKKHKPSSAIHATHAHTHTHITAA